MWGWIVGKKITPRMLEVLHHAQAGRRIDTGLVGRSDYGGLSRTLTALTSAGLLRIGGCEWEITEAGRAAIKQSEPKS